MDALLDNVLRFAAFLRDAGVSINAGRMPDVVTAMESIGVRQRGDVRAAMRLSSSSIVTKTLSCSMPPSISSGRRARRGSVGCRSYRWVNGRG